MLYYLLNEHYNIIHYISFRAAGAAITGTSRTLSNSGTIYGGT